jgi:hypothetical protein
MVARGVGAEIAFNSSGGADAWIMLMPLGTGNVLTTVDGRGPYSAGLNRRAAPKRKERPPWHTLQPGGGLKGQVRSNSVAPRSIVRR